MISVCLCVWFCSSCMCVEMGAGLSSLGLTRHSTGSSVSCHKRVVVMDEVDGMSTSDRFVVVTKCR